MISDISDLGTDILRTRVCIAGAGAAGIAIASELLFAHCDTVILESGRREFDHATQALYGAEVAGLSHAGVHDLRVRTFGGSTTRWAGQVMPLSDVDFSKRAWIPWSGWPIAEDELRPVYDRAARVVGVPSLADLLATPPEAPPVDREIAEPAWSVFGPQPNFARLHGPALAAAASVSVVLGANVTEIVADASGGAIEYVRAVSLNGEALKVVADVFVLCLGGIEVPRMLLASGVASSNDLVGRLFQDHPGFAVGRLRELNDGLGAFRLPRRRGLKHGLRFVSAPVAQAREQLLQAASGVTFDLTQPESIRAGKRLVVAARNGALRAEAPGAIGTILRDPIPLVRAASRHYVRGRSALDTSTPPVLVVGCEQAPNPESRVTLSEERDDLGVPRARLTWRLTELEIKTCRRFAEQMIGEFERLGVATLDDHPFELPDEPGALSARVVDAGHHMGTTRMSADPASGVVDSHCRVHGMDNLYIGSCSVFPTGGISNPTFTMLALCMRIADDIKAQLGSRA